MVVSESLNTTIEGAISQTRDGVGKGDGGQTAATIEAVPSQTRDGVGNGDGGQTAATREAGIPQNRDGVGKGDGGQTAATIEAVPSQTRDGICDAIISHCFRNRYVTGVFIIIRFIIVSLKSDCSRLVGCIQIVEDSIYLCVMSPGRKGKT